jgi:hypothetical protein
MRKGTLWIAIFLCLGMGVKTEANPAPAGRLCSATTAQAALPAFLAGLPPAQPAGSGGRGGSLQATCTSTNACANGSPLTCTGATCSANAYSVQCDGVTQTCPVACTEVCSACGEKSCQGYISCDDGVNWIQCDSHRYTCLRPSQCP